jgi:hypothetical protein
MFGDDLGEAERWVAGRLGKKAFRRFRRAWFELASPGLPSGLRRFGLRFDDVHSPRRRR